MILDWNAAIQEIDRWLGGSLELPDIGPTALDSLHGSMWGLNHRYVTLGECAKQHKRSLGEYAIQRLERIAGQPNITCLERSGPSRCPIGFGTYGWKYDPKLIRTAAHLNMGLIDTAEGYGYGRVEKALGSIFKSMSNQIDVATKVRRDHMSHKALPRAARRSRNKLKKVPHYQLHFPNASCDDMQLAFDLVALRREGTIKSIGLGNCSTDMVEWWQRFLVEYSGDCIRSVQIEYSLINRRIEDVLLPYCQANGILVIAYSPLGQDTRQLVSPGLHTIADRVSATATQVALAWLLSHPGVMPIPRTNNLRHLRENAEAEGLVLSADMISELEDMYPKNSQA